MEEPFILNGLNVDRISLQETELNRTNFKCLAHGWGYLKYVSEFIFYKKLNLNMNKKFLKEFRKLIN